MLYHFFSFTVVLHKHLLLSLALEKIQKEITEKISFSYNELTDVLSLMHNALSEYESKYFELTSSWDISFNHIQSENFFLDELVSSIWILFSRFVFIFLYLSCMLIIKSRQQKIIHNSHSKFSKTASVSEVSVLRDDLSLLTEYTNWQAYYADEL